MNLLNPNFMQKKKKKKKKKNGPRTGRHKDWAESTGPSGWVGGSKKAWNKDALN